MATSGAVSAASAGAPRRLWRHAHGLLTANWFRHAMWPLGLAVEVAVLWPLLVGDQVDTATTADVLNRVSGGSFVACGLIAWQRRPSNRIGALMVAVGSAILGTQLLSQLDSSLATTLGLLSADYWTILFVILLLVFPHGRPLARTVDRLVVVVFAIPVVALQPFWMLFYEESGFDNEFLVWPNAHVADAVDKSQRALLVFATVVLVLVLVQRWLKASPPLRRVLVPVLAGAVYMLALAALLIADLISGSRSPAVQLLESITLAIVPLAFLAGFLRSRLARVAVGELLIGLRDTPSPAKLRRALAKSLGDPSLALLYWLPDHVTWVSAEGVPVALPAAGGGRATRIIERDGERVAALVHDESLLDEPELVDAAAAAAGIALESARLHEDIQAGLDELRASRSRLVEASDTERRRLERNLHDGAQQRLVAVTLQLRLIEARIRGDPAEAERLVRTAGDELVESLDELRELARGLHPAVLDHGLLVALESLAARSAVATTVTVRLQERLPEPVELAAYFVASEALANVAKHAQAAAVRIAVSRSGLQATIEVSDDGVGGADDASGSGLRGLADRVEALGGSLRISSPVGAGTTITAEIPCGS